MVAIALVLVLWDCGLRRAEATALTWSDIERWDDGSGQLLIGRSKTDQTGEGEVVFITRRAMTALDELRQLRCDASPSVFGLVDQSINRRVKAPAPPPGSAEVSVAIAAGWAWPGGWPGPARRTRRS